MIIEYDRPPQVEGPGAIRTVGDVPTDKAGVLALIQKPGVIGFALGFLIARMLR